MKTTLERDDYGTLHATFSTTKEDLALLATGRKLVAMASKADKIRTSYDNILRDRKGRYDGYALHHEIYDMTPTASRVLLCCRKTEGTKYGVKTTSKDYYIVAKCGTGCTVKMVSKAIAAKAAKSYADELGHAIAICTGKEKLKVSAQETRCGFKALTVNTTGNPVSVWDGSPWTIGKTRIEKATDSHDGGFYYYKTITEVIEAAAKNSIFGNAREHKSLIIAKVAVSGREYRHDGGKLCATKITPVEIVASII